MMLGHRALPRVLSRRDQAGFTLIEVMVVVIIIGVLATIAYASYREQIIKTRRSAAQVCLSEAAQTAARYYTVKLTYVGLPSPASACVSELSSFYTISIHGTPGTNTYKLQAVPKGAQTDTRCGTMTLDQAGVKTATSTTGCW